VAAIPRDGFAGLIEQVPPDVYRIAAPLVSDDVALFRPRSFIVDKAMRSEDYSFILPSTVPPRARIGGRDHQFRRGCMIAVGSDVEFLCKVKAPTREYVNIVIKRDFFERVASEAVGRARVDFSKVVYARSPRLLRTVADLENELAYHNGDCPLMVGSITAQMIVRVLRDTGIHTRSGWRHEDSSAYLNVAAAGHNSANPALLALLSEVNRSLPTGGRLTPRELEIAAYLLERMDYETMAMRLLISPNTVKTHARNIYDKLGVSGRKGMALELARLASTRTD